MLELFTRLELAEPSEETALEIARHAARRLEQTYRVSIPDHVVARTVLLGSNFLPGAARNETFATRDLA